MSDEISAYNESQAAGEKLICDRLRDLIDSGLPEAESKIWHAHPVWFLDNNPTVGYSKLKAGIRLMFWSGADFDEPGLEPGTGKFKDASAIYTSVDQVDARDLERWLEQSRTIQWDYENLMKNRNLVKREA